MSRKNGLVTLIGPSIILVGALALTGCSRFGGETAAAAPLPTTSASATPEPTETPTAEPVDLEACRVEAVTAYMQRVGFLPGQFTVGIELIDHSYPELTSGGSLNYWEIVDTRDKFAELLTSSDIRAQASVDGAASKAPDIPREELTNPDNWEAVQMLVPSQLIGNSGLGTKGAVIPMGDRQSAAGDAAWLFVDTNKCEVVPIAAEANGGEVDDKSAIVIRVGCSNPGSGLAPKDPNQDPGRNGNNGAAGATQNTNMGLDEYVAPEDVPVVPTTPYVPPAPPVSTAPPVGTTPSGDSAPPKENPTDPVITGCAPAPGKPCP